MNLTDVYYLTANEAYWLGVYPDNSGNNGEGWYYEGEDGAVGPFETEAEARAAQNEQ